MPWATGRCCDPGGASVRGGLQRQTCQEPGAAGGVAAGGVAADAAWRPVQMQGHCHWECGPEPRHEPKGRTQAGSDCQVPGVG